MTSDSRKIIHLKITSISAKFAEKWNAVYRTTDNFLNKNKSCLEGNNLEFKISLHRSCTSTTFEGSWPQGRPKNNFKDSSIKTKSLGVVELVQSRSASELTTAAEIAHRLLGKER